MKIEKPVIDTYICNMVTNSFCSLALVLGGERSHLTFRFSNALNLKRLRTSEVLKTLITDKLRISI